MMLDVKSQNDEWSFENKFVSQKARNVLTSKLVHSMSPSLD
jgi:hypothetical protein